MARRKKLGSRVTPKKEHSGGFTVYGDAFGPRVLVEVDSGLAFGFCCVCTCATELNFALPPIRQRCSRHLVV